MKDLINLTGPELSKRLGEILQPRTSRHWFVKKYKATNGHWYKRCRNCNKILPAGTSNGPCGTDSIPLNDWNIAMKWKEWGIKEWGQTKFLDHLKKVFLQDEPGCFTEYRFLKWLVAKVQPEHFLIAAATLKESQDGK